MPPYVASQVPEHRGPHQQIRRLMEHGYSLAADATVYITPGTRAPRRIRKFSREPQPQWPRRPGLRARVRDLRGQNTIPDFYPGLVRTAPENLFNNRQWRPRRPSTRGGDGDRLALGRSPMGPQTPSRPTASSPTDQARFQWGLQQRDIDNQSAAAESPRVATDTGKTSLNDDLQVLERGRAEPSAAVDSAPPFSQARGRS
jgi:hypothetical protein